MPTHLSHGTAILSNQNSVLAGFNSASTASAALTVATQLAVITEPATDIANGLIAIQLPPNQRVTLWPIVQHSSDGSGKTATFQFFGVREAPKITSSRADNRGFQYKREYLGSVTVTGSACATPALDIIPSATSSKYCDTITKVTDTTRRQSMDINVTTAADGRITIDYDGAGWLEVGAIVGTATSATFIWTTHS